MSIADFDKWLPIAMSLPRESVENPLTIPQAIFLGEAADIVRELEKHWDRTDDIPSLKRNAGRLSLAVKDEILELRRAIFEADSRWVLAAPPSTPVGVLERARVVRRELVAALDYLLDDDVEEPADQQLASLKSTHADDGDSADEIAKQLYNYAKLGEPLTARLEELGDDFDVKLIKEAFTLAEALGSVEGPGRAEATPEARQVLGVRNRLLHLLVERVGLVRRAAAFKYRNYPETLKNFTSAYERRRRAASRAKKEKTII